MLVLFSSSCVWYSKIRSVTSTFPSTIDSHDLTSIRGGGYCQVCCRELQGFLVVAPNWPHMNMEIGDIALIWVWSLVHESLCSKLNVLSLYPPLHIFLMLLCCYMLLTVTEVSPLLFIATLRGRGVLGCKNQGPCGCIISYLFSLIPRFTKDPENRSIGLSYPVVLLKSILKPNYRLKAKLHSLIHVHFFLYNKEFEILFIQLCNLGRCSCQTAWGGQWPHSSWRS